MKVNTWQVTLSLINDEGCDVITSYCDSNAAAVAANEKSVYYISTNSDMSEFAPDVFLTALRFP